MSRPSQGLARCAGFTLRSWIRRLTPAPAGNQVHCAFLWYGGPVWYEAALPAPPLSSPPQPGAIAMQFDQEIDTRGRTCPMPVLLAKRMLDTMAPGQVLRVTASDPNAPADFAKFARRSGHEMLVTAPTENGIELFLRRA